MAFIYGTDVVISVLLYVHVCICVYVCMNSGREQHAIPYLYMYTDAIEEAVINLLVYIYNGAGHLDPLTHLCGGQRGCRAHTSYIHMERRWPSHSFYTYVECIGCRFRPSYT